MKEMREGNSMGDWKVGRKERKEKERMKEEGWKGVTLEAGRKIERKGSKSTIKSSAIYRSPCQN